MGIWSKLFGATPVVASSSLIKDLISNDEPTFLAALKTAADLAAAGDPSGIGAMREALILRSSKTGQSFYKPGLVITQDVESYLEERGQRIKGDTWGARPGNRPGLPDSKGEDRLNGTKLPWRSTLRTKRGVAFWKGIKTGLYRHIDLLRIPANPPSETWATGLMRRRA